MILDKILEIEDKYGLVEKQIDGYPYWVLFRFQIYQRIFMEKDGVNPHHYLNQTSFMKRIGALWDRVNTLAKNRYYPKKQSDYLFVSGGRKVLNDGEYVDTITDTIMSRYPSSMLFEYSVGGVHYRPTRAKNVYYSDRYGLLSEGSAKLRPVLRTSKYKQVLQIIRSELETPLREMCDAQGVSIDFGPVFSDIAEYYYVYRSLKKNYRKFLQKIRPKVILIVVHYERQRMIFAELAKDMGIPTIELQHGTSGVEHPAYNYFRVKEVRQFPDYFFAFSRFWTQQARFPIPEDHRIAVGNPYGEWRTNELKKTVPKSEPAMILFLSQPGRGETLSVIAADLYETIDRDQYQIVYKMHPSEHLGWEKRYTRMKEAGVPVADNTNSDLYTLFAQASYVVATGNTTALYEALQFGMPCFIHIDQSMVEFQKLYEEGMVGGINSAAELLALIQKPQHEERKNAFWESNSLEKMQDAIERVIRSEK